MPSKNSIERYRGWYAALLKLYSREHYQRFAVGMEQTFVDRLRERHQAHRSTAGCALAMFLETFTGIVRERTTSMIRSELTTRLAVWAAVVALILMVPFVAMQFSTEVNWSFFDFLAAGILLFGTGAAFELISRKGGSSAYRAAVGLGLGATLLLIWINLAVGIIGSEDNPANTLYGAVLLVGFAGVVISQLNARGMSRAMFATAAVQLLVPLVALLIWQPSLSTTAEIVDVVRVLLLNGFFAVLFVGSALLFRRASAVVDTRP